MPVLATRPPGSPKQPQPEHQRDWYPYYAGFTQQFVDAVISSHGKRARNLLDPWNGTGTTTLAAAKRGLGGAGIDINPALTIIARSRLTPRNLADGLVSSARALIAAAEGREAPRAVADPLEAWLRPSAARHIRALQNEVDATFGVTAQEGTRLQPAVLADSMPLIASFFYTVLFAVARDLVARFRASNPTWLLQPKDYRRRIAPGWNRICQVFLQRVTYFTSRLSFVDPTSPRRDIALRTLSATALPWADSTFDLAVTSPPYATRIDYVRSMLLELALLGASLEEVQELRTETTGTTVVMSAPTVTNELRSGFARQLLANIRAHESKGSAGYYYPWMKKYLQSLEKGLLETARVVAPSGRIAIVVQDSHYKELSVDLQKIVTETLVSECRNLIAREDFVVRHHRARMNPRALRHLASRRNIESLLVFR